MIKHIQTARPAGSRRKLYLLYGAVFLGSVLIFTAYVLLRLGAGYLHKSFGDGWLYISVADNLLDNGHFIQTYREGLRENMVVPFGLPLLLLPLRLITRGEWLVTVVQYILFGLTNVFLAAAARRAFGARGLFAPAFYTLAVMFRYESSPAIFCLTEPWYLFFLSLALWVLSCEDMALPRRVTLLNAFTFAALAIRPAMAVFYIPALAAAVVLTARKKLSVRRCAALIAIPALVLAANTLVNYRETGVPVLLENYSSVDNWRANNPDSVPGEEEGYEAFFEDGVVDYAEQSEIYSDMCREYTMEYPEKYAGDTAARFYELFVELWRWLIIPVSAAAVYLIVRDRRRRLIGLIAALVVLLCVLSSTTVVNGRYTIFVAPFWCLALSSAVSDAAAFIALRAKQSPLYMSIKGIKSDN